MEFRHIHNSKMGQTVYTSSSYQEVGLYKPESFGGNHHPHPPHIRSSIHISRKTIRLLRSADMGLWTISVLFLLAFLSLPQSCWTSSIEKTSYGVVIDAGSSGSRVRIYEWLESSDCRKLPNFEETSSFKRNPGISDFATSVVGMEDYLKGLIDYAKELVPNELHKQTPLYLMATAGMRLLMEPNANRVMNRINELLLKPSVNPFRYAARNTRILSGEEEGSFAWIAVNYLLGFFSGDVEESAGILELGGASTQIAFLHDGAILADKWPMKIAGESYALYVHSYLYYGQELTVKWVKERIADSNTQTNTLINPCMLKGDNQTEYIRGRNITFSGSSESKKCEEIVVDFIYKVPEYRCYPKPCAISNTYQPSISLSKRFYALSAFLFNLQDIDAINDDGTFTPAQVVVAAHKYCSKTYEEAKAGLPLPNKWAFLSSNCVMGLYMPLLFTNGYGFANDTSQIIAIKKLKETSLEWALGAIIYEHEREERLCSQVRLGSSVSSAISSHSSHQFSSYSGHQKGIVISFSAMYLVCIQWFMSQ